MSGENGCVVVPVASEAEIVRRALAGEALTDEERAVLRVRAAQDASRPVGDLVYQALPVRLDLGSGENTAPGFEGVDMFAPGAKHRVDLMRFPWPWESNSVDELHCSHFIEHIPMVFVERVALNWKDPEAKNTMTNVMPGPGRVDLLLAFFNECHRIMKPGANMKLIWPALQSVRAFMDPTHRRFLPPEFTFYLSRAWRELNKLEHYLGATCNFEASATATLAEIETKRAPEVQQQRVATLWNVAGDWHCTLRKVP